MRNTWLAIFALTIAACAPPTLDQTGAIRCGTEGDGGLCPSGFECRWDYCCPTSSTTRSCPAPGRNFAADPTGHVYAPIGGACPEGYENRFDYCCPVGSASTCPSRVIGAPCAADTDCDAPTPGTVARCLTNQYVDSLHQRFPIGYCIAENCDPAAANACGPNAYCAPSGGGQGYCFRSCTLATGTIFGPCTGSSGNQLCVTRNDVNDPTLGSCFPDCSRPENANQCQTPTYDCFEVFTGVHACAKVCDPTRAMFCGTGQVCSNLTGRGYCHSPM